jgi:phenylacetate-CoA ligase
MNNFGDTGLAERLRSHGFWFIDRFRSFRYSDEMSRIAGYHADPVVHESVRLKRLHELLGETQKHVPFYREAQPGQSLADWPVVTKDMIREAPERFRRDGFDHGGLLRVSTSGSSGQPFECFHEPEKVRRKLADLLYFNGRVGYEVGMRHMLIRATRKPKWKLLLQNEVWVDPTHWDDALRASMRARLLGGGGVRVAIGYPSVMADLAAYCQEKGDTRNDFRLRSYIATSELVSTQQRDLIREAFGCRVVSRYASEEFGVVGQSEDDCEHFCLNTGSLVLEILDSRNQPVEPGSRGRVVVTDLTMRKMPLIRYDLGDLAIAGKPVPEILGVTSIASIEGKITDMITDAKGRAVSPHAVLVALKKVRGVRQFQFAQTGTRRYELRLSPETTVVAAGMQETLRDILGVDAEIVVRRMPEIPALPSGKRPVVVNEWKGRKTSVGCALP